MDILQKKIKVPGMSETHADMVVLEKHTFTDGIHSIIQLRVNIEDTRTYVCEVDTSNNVLCWDGTRIKFEGRTTSVTVS